jgi:VanZ family protein
VINRLFGTAFLAVAWTILIQILLCIPGSDLTKTGLFSIPNFDKFAHIVLFGSFVGLWCYYFYLKKKPAGRLKTLFFLVFLIAAANGIIMEFVQRDYVPNRSFDEGDIIADLITSSIAYGVCNIKLLKTKL